MSIESFVESNAIPSKFRIDPKDNPAVYVCDGEVHTWEGESWEVHSPIATRGANGPEPILLGHHAAIGEAEAYSAVEAALRAWQDGFGEWPSASLEDRIAAVERFCGRLEEHAERMATLLMFEIGKPLASARKEVVRSIEYTRETIAKLRALSATETFTGQKGSTTHYAREQREPLGIVLCVAPFNYPVNELLTTIIPALLMGNVVIAKTPRFGMLANLVAAKAYADCFPAGAVSLLPGGGREVITPIMRATHEHGGKKAVVDMLAFIGSEGAANAILGYHPTPIVLHKVLGLGSKNAAIVLDGADLAHVASRVVKGSLGFNGQRCTAEKLICVPRAQAEEFAGIFAAEVAGLKVGMPWEDGVAITPLPEGPDKLHRMREYVEDAESHGARVMNEGGGEGAHALMRPAVLYPVDPSMRLFHEEQFGPLVPIAPYDDIEEVIAWQKASEFGQQTGIWGPTERAVQIGRRMAKLVSRVNINDVCQRGPDSFGFTATDKSGFGVLSLKDALLTFSRPVLLQSTEREAVDP